MTDPTSVPGQHVFGPAVDRFDAAIDRLLETVRGRRLPDEAFSAASHYGDFSAIWHAVGAARAVVLRRPDQAITLAVLLAAESLVVNQGVKRLFRRERPTETGDDRLPVRRPSTSAFPSGHASSAFFAASVLTGWDGPRWGVLWFTLAACVGTSRAYVRIHHASDVVGGAVVGLALGVAGRRIARAVAP